MSSAPRDVLDLWLGGRFAGQLMRGESGDVELVYDNAYQNDRGTAPLSTSMPKTHGGYGPDRVMPWLSNLLPDAIEVRDRWAANFGETRNDPFTLLRHMGQDAPGSVQVVPEGEVPSQTGELTPISEQEISQRVQGILDDPDNWVDDSDDNESRFSLGGNQGKFALVRTEGGWRKPNGRSASTHIVKPGMVTTTGKTNDEVQAVEFVSMRASRRSGIPTAQVDIMDFAGRLTFVTTRYDRIELSGAVQRVHQEDFCQALGYLPSRKYEVDGGPGMRQMVELVRQTSSQGFRESDTRVLVRLMAYNLLIAGVDAHAKNHSLMLFGDQVRLAPAYDLISAHGLWDADRVQDRSSAAVKYGKNRRYRNISGRDLVRTADVVGMERGDFLELIRAMQLELPGAFEESIAELPASFQTDLIKRMPARLQEFSKQICDRSTAADIAETSRFSPPVSSTQQVPGSAAIWVAGHWQGDNWVNGYYRGRPR